MELLAECQEAGELERVSHGGGRDGNMACWRIKLPGLSLTNSAEARTFSSEDRAAKGANSRTISGVEKVRTLAAKGANSRTKGANSRPPTPPIEHQENTSNTSALLLVQNRSALEARGVGEPKRSELAGLAGLTPTLIDQTPGAPGLIVTRLPDLAAAAVAERVRRAARERARAERAALDEAARDQIAAERAAVAAWLAGLNDQERERWRAAAIAAAPRTMAREWARADLSAPGGWVLKTAMHRAAHAAGDTEMSASENGNQKNERNGTRAGGGIGSNEKYRGLLSQSHGRGG